jgi:excisionase family DNA binding protein
MSLTEREVVLTTKEAIEYLRICKPTFLKYVHLGKIKAIKAGKGWRILLSELDRFLKGDAFSLTTQYCKRPLETDGTS